MIGLALSAVIAVCDSFAISLPNTLRSSLRIRRDSSIIPAFLPLFLFRLRANCFFSTNFRPSKRDFRVYILRKSGYTFMYKEIDFYRSLLPEVYLHLFLLCLSRCGVIKQKKKKEEKKVLSLSKCDMCKLRFWLARSLFLSRFRNQLCKRFLKRSKNGGIYNGAVGFLLVNVSREIHAL